MNKDESVRRAVVPWPRAQVSTGRSALTVWEKHMAADALIGISYGEVNRFLSPGCPYVYISWLIRFAAREQPVFPGGRAEAVLEVTGYEGPEDQSRIVRIVLRRASGVIIFSAGMNRLMMGAMPALVWAT